MAPISLSPSCRTRRTPFSSRVEMQGVQGYTVYNHMLLPTAFRSLEEDYWHLRENVQVWDVSAERQVEISGPDAARLCQLMTPRDLGRVVVGQCVYAPITDRKGKMINDPVILKLAADRFWISIADSDVLLYAKGLAIGFDLDVSVFEPDICPLAVQGPKAEDLMARVFGDDVRDIRFFRFARLAHNGQAFVVARSGWSKQGGFEIYVDHQESGQLLWDTLFEKGKAYNIGPGCPNLIERIEGGLFSYGNDFNLSHTPLECGLEKYCALDGDFDFIGKSALIKQRAQGITRRISGIIYAGTSCPACVESWILYAGEEIVGQVNSAVYSPNLKCNIGFAMIDAPYWDSGRELILDAPDGQHKVTVCDIPFV